MYMALKAMTCRYNYPTPDSGKCEVPMRFIPRYCSDVPFTTLEGAFKWIRSFPSGSSAAHSWAS